MEIHSFILRHQFWSTVIVTLFVLVQHTEGQGRMLEPPGRSSLWMFGYNAPINYNDNVLSCGGVVRQWYANEGKCGVCGDPWDANPREHEAGGRFATGIVARTYTSGTVLKVTVDVAVNNGGYFEFRLCANNDVTKPVTEACLEAGLLTVKGSDGSESPQGLYKVQHAGNTTVHVYLPPKLTCSQCVLQWKYTTADHYGCDTNAARFPTAYYACSDISIIKSDKNAQRPQQTVQETVQEGKRSQIDSKSRVKRRAGRTTFFENGGILGIGMANPFDTGPTGDTRQLLTTYRPEPVQFTSFRPRRITVAPETAWSWRRSNRGPNSQNLGIVINPYQRNRAQFKGGARFGGNMMAAEAVGPSIRRTSTNGRMNRRRPQSATFVQVEEAQPMRTFGQVGTSHVQQTFLSGNLEPELTVSRVNLQASTNQVSVANGNCKSVGQYRSPAMDSWCNQQCAGQSPCAISYCSCPPARKYKKTVPQVDTCDKCPFNICWDDTMSLENIFPGLFANPTTFLQCNNLEELFTLGTFKVISEGLPECNHPRFKRQAIQMDDDDGGCCSTRPQVIMPLTVESKNETFDVVQLPNDRNQLLVQGICRRNSTLSCPVCTAQNNFQWVLVFDRRINSSPPVTFVPVRFPHYCRCRNPGGLIVNKDSPRKAKRHKTFRVAKKQPRTQSKPMMHH